MDWLGRKGGLERSHVALILDFDHGKLVFSIELNPVWVANEQTITFSECPRQERYP